MPKATWIFFYGKLPKKENMLGKVLIKYKLKQKLCSLGLKCPEHKKRFVVIKCMLCSLW